MTQTQGVDFGVWGTGLYVVSFPCVLTLLEYMLEGFPERAHDPGRIREHYIYRHWKSQIAILREGEMPLL